MSRTVKIETRLWNDLKFASLSDRARLAYFFISTHPHLTAVGAMRASLPGLAAELRWRERHFREAIQELSHQGLVRYCETAFLVWLPNFLKSNRPESPNVVKSWEGLLDLLPECALRDELLLRVQEFVATLGEGFRQALPEAFRVAPTRPEPIPALEPEPERSVPVEKSATIEEIQPVHRGCSDLQIPIPESLQTVEFMVAWNDWQSYCRAGDRPISVVAGEAQLRMLAKWGPAASIEAIRHSISRQWIGVLKHSSMRAPLEPLRAA